MDPYIVLGISHTASDDEIKTRYRQLSRKYHPDANINNPNKEEAEEQFKRIQQAYKAIMNERGKGSSFGGGFGNRNYNNTDRQNYQSKYSYNEEDNYTNWWQGFNPFTTFNDVEKEIASWPDDITSNRLRAAINYARNGSIKEAQNTLNSIDFVDARWYFVNAQIAIAENNHSKAIENIQRACTMDPDNATYQALRRQMQSTGNNWYESRGETYGRKTSLSPILCLPCIACGICSVLSRTGAPRIC